MSNLGWGMQKGLCDSLGSDREKSCEGECEEASAAR